MTDRRLNIGGSTLLSGAQRGGGPRPKEQRGPLTENRKLLSVLMPHYRRRARHGIKIAQRSEHHQKIANSLGCLKYAYCASCMRATFFKPKLQNSETERDAIKIADYRYTGIVFQIHHLTNSRDQHSNQTIKKVCRFFYLSGKGEVVLGFR